MMATRYFQRSRYSSSGFCFVRFFFFCRWSGGIVLPLNTCNFCLHYVTEEKKSCMLFHLKVCIFPQCMVFLLKTSQEPPLYFYVFLTLSRELPFPQSRESKRGYIKGEKSRSSSSVLKPTLVISAVYEYKDSRK